jgi:predicted GNAT superfamily acetyltransferase
VITIRELTEHADFAQAVELQKEIWGFNDLETLPVRLFVVAHKIGGQVFGAFDEDRMVGFLLALPGIRRGGLQYLHSQMLGILPEYRDHGVGRRMKLRQRDHAMSHGIQLIEWTFDPLEPRNAFFNLCRLGAIVRRHVENQYGRTTSSLHTGLPTDRFVAEWWLRTEHVDRVLSGETAGAPPIVERISVPLNIYDLRREDPEAAREVQKRIAETCRRAFAQDLAIVGFERTDTDFGYLLAEWQ